jgi:hypothetical protein
MAIASSLLPLEGSPDFGVPSPGFLGILRVGKRARTYPKLVTKAAPIGMIPPKRFKPSRPDQGRRLVILHFAPLS